VDRFFIGVMFVYTMIVGVVFGTMAAGAFQEGNLVFGGLLAIGSGAIGLATFSILRAWK